MRFVNLSSCKHLFDIGTPERKLEKVEVSRSGHFACAIGESGHLYIFDLKAAAHNLHTVYYFSVLFNFLSSMFKMLFHCQPPPPVVKILDKDKNRNSNASKANSEELEVY